MLETMMMIFQVVVPVIYFMVIVLVLMILENSLATKTKIVECSIVFKTYVGFGEWCLVVKNSKGKKQSVYVPDVRQMDLRFGTLVLVAVTVGKVSGLVYDAELV